MNTSPRCDINMTPLLDVLLVLVLILVVVALAPKGSVEVGVPIHLPKGHQTLSAAESTEPLILSLDKEGQLFLRDQKMDQGLLIETLKKLPEELTSRIHLRADQNLTYAKVMEIMAALSAKGFSKIVLLVDGRP